MIGKDSEKDENHDIDAEVNRGSGTHRQQTDGRGDPSVRAAMDGDDAADQHDPDHQQASDFFGPGNRTVHQVSTADLYADSKNDGQHDQGGRVHDCAVKPVFGDGGAPVTVHGKFRGIVHYGRWRFNGGYMLRHC
ncbi:MAG: hypothetical protein JZU55_06005 [Afipia sp.]|nr:hypothetical protein [Afipia sp.]